MLVIPPRSKSLPEVAPHIKHLTVSDNDLTGPALASLIGQARPIVLRAARNRLGQDEGAAALASALGAARELDLADNGLRDAGIASLAPALGTGLGRLVLDCNGMSPDGARRLAAVLRRLPLLYELSLSGNKALGDEGATLVATPLVHSLTLQTLDLSDCSLSAEFGYVAAALVEGSATLHTLILRGNKLAGRGATVVCKSLAGPGRSLTYLDVSMNGLENDGCAVFSDMLSKNTSLLHLDMSGNGVSKKSVDALLAKLALNKRLCSFVFIQSDVAAQLLAAPHVLPRSLTNVIVGGGELASPLGARLDMNLRTMGQLDAAVRLADVDSVLELLNGGVDVQHRDKEGNSVLHLAAASGAGARVVSALLAASIGLLFWENNKQQTPLEVALTSQTLGSFAVNPAVLFICLRQALRPSMLPVFMGLASVFGNAAVRSAVDASGRTLLHIACELGLTEIAQVLLNVFKIDPTAALFQGLNPLHLTCIACHYELFRLLLEGHPVLAEAWTPKSKKMLHLASMSGFVPGIKLLVEKLPDLDINERTSEDLTAPLHFAATPEAVRELVSCGAKVDVLDVRDQTPLLTALLRGDLDVASALIDCGAQKKLAFPRVTSLNVEHRWRHGLPAFIAHLPNLKDFACVNGNPLTSIPQGVVNRGNMAVLNYLQDISSLGQKVQWKTFKVLSLGREGSGKTHLKKLLSGEKYTRNESTDGIEVSSFMLAKKYSVVWFDFGGQEVFYPTHNFFLTPQCVYLLVFNVSDKDYLSRLTYWLRCVGSISPDARQTRAVVVGTHVDKVTEQQLTVVKATIDDLMMRVPSAFVVGTLYLSITQDANDVPGQLSRAIELAAQRAGLIDREVPKTYTAVHCWVQSQKARQKMSFTEMVKNFEGVDDMFLERACLFLHDMGQLFFSKSADLVCFDVQYLAALFSSLLTFRHNWVKRGVVTETELKHVWPNFSSAEINGVCKLFQLFHIVHKRRDTKTKSASWVVPSLLPSEQDFGSAVVPERVVARRSYQCQFIPAGVFGRLLSMVMEWKDAVITSSYRHGFEVVIGNEKARVTEEGSDLELDVFRTGPRAVGTVSLLRRLDEEIRQVFRSCFNRRLDAPFECMITCSHCLDTQISHSECVSRIVNGRDSFECKGEMLPLAILGDDIVLDYVRVIRSDECEIESVPFASGGSGDVFKAKLLGETVVVKQIKMSLEDSLREFYHEVFVMSQLSHQNLVSLIGIMFSPLSMFVEHCEEGDLLEALQRGKIQTKEHKIRIATDIAAGMNYLHSLNPPLAHRDLRSPNIFLVGTEPSRICAKVADFGLAVSVSTFSDEALLTWQWMAPEAYHGQLYDERADLFSFGIILWELLAGKGEIPYQEYASNPEFAPGLEVVHSVMNKGLRPTLKPSVVVVPVLQVLMTQLWDAVPARRPSFDVCLHQLLRNTSAENKLLLRRARMSWSTKSTMRVARASATQPQMSFHISIKLLPLSVPDRIRCVLRVGDALWLGMDGGGVYCVELSSGAVESEHKGAHGERPVNTLVIGPDRKVWSAGDDGRILRWERRSVLPPRSSSSSNNLALPVQAPREWVAPKLGSSESLSPRLSPRVSPRVGRPAVRMGRSRASGSQPEEEGDLDNPHRRAKVLCMVAWREYCASGDSKGTLCVWKNDCVAPELQLKHAHPVVSMAIALDVLYVVIGNDILRLDLASKSLVHFATHSCARLPRIQTVGHSLLSFSKEEMILWNLADATVVVRKKENRSVHVVETFEFNGLSMVVLGSNDEIIIMTPSLAVFRRVPVQGDVSAFSDMVLTVRQKGTSSVFVMLCE